MDITKMFVRDGKVVFKKTTDTCGIEDGDPAHVFNNGQSKPCDCGHHKSFFHAESDGLSKEPVRTKGHLSLYRGGKTSI